MTNDEREKFWEKLEGSTKEGDVDAICEAIKYPQYLYRYRRVDNSSLSALAENKLFFSTANYYDDPFDTFIHINVEKLEKDIGIWSQGENLEFVLQKYARCFGTPIPQMTDIDPKYALSVLSKFLKDVRNDIKKGIWSYAFLNKVLTKLYG